MLVAWFVIMGFDAGFNEKEEWAKLSHKGSLYPSLLGLLTGLSYGAGPEAPGGNRW